MKRRETTIDGYLKARQAEMPLQTRGPVPVTRPFVTISRQAGAGGHTLADTLLEVFAEQDDPQLFSGWQVFDRKLCEIVAANPAYEGSMESLLAEEYRTKTEEFLRQLLGTSHDQDQLMFYVFRVVTAVASIGKSIILGRAGSELTRDMHGGVSVRLIAPEACRIKGVMEHYGIDNEAAARDRARNLDTSRARLLRSHFGVNIDDPERYDMVWNTGRVPFRTIAESVAVMLRTGAEAARSEARR
jgi:cytidylate kinase